MDFGLTPDQESVRDLARQVTDGAATDALWSALGAAGLLGLALPEEHGGAALGTLEAALVAEEVGRVAAQVPLAETLAAAAAVASHGSPALRSALLPGVADGSAVFTTAFGDDALDPWAQAVAEGDAWRLTGTQVAVPFLEQSHTVLVPARTDDGQTLLAVVDPAAGGVQLTAEWTTSGRPAATLNLAGATAHEALPGTALARAYAHYLALLCATELGVAAEALRMAAAHTSTREQFGRPLATFQAVAVRLGDGYIDVQAIRSTLWQALYLLDAGLPADEALATAAFWAAEGGERVLSSAVHLHGGLGVDTSYPLHRWFLASKAIEIALGGASRLVDRVGALLFAAP